MKTQKFEAVYYTPQTGRKVMTSIHYTSILRRARQVASKYNCDVTIDRCHSGSKWATGGRMVRVRIEVVKAGGIETLVQGQLL